MRCGVSVTDERSHIWSTRTVRRKRIGEREREYMYKSKTNLLFIQMMVYDSFLLPLTLYLSASPDEIL